MSYYRTITFAAPDATLTNFPALVRISNDAGMKARIANANGYDVAFQDAGGNALAFELDFYDANTGSGAWWVRVPTLESSGPTTIRMTYGNASVTTNQSDAATVWADYETVLHLNSTDQTQQFNSATGTYAEWVNHANITSIGFSTGQNSVTGRNLTFVPSGPAGGGGNSPYLLTTCPAGRAAGSICVFSTTYHWQFRFYDSGYGNGMNAMWGTDPVTGVGAYVVRCRWNNTSGGNSNVDLSGVSPTEGLMCVQSRWQREPSRQIHFRANGMTHSAATYLGYHTNTDKWLQAYYDYGRISGHSVTADELRYTPIVRSDAWLSYEFNQCLNHGDYTTYGAEYNADGTRVFTLRSWMQLPHEYD